MNFEFEHPQSVEAWKTVDDVVMGGVSSSRVRWVDAASSDDVVEQVGAGMLRFEGEVSLENNGGFCSARLTEADRGEAGIEALRLLVRGDGHRYKFTVRTSASPPNSSWRLPIEPPAGRWEELRLPLADFELWRRGTHLSAEAELDPAAITSLGLLISDGQEGPFCLDVGYIR